MWPPQPFRSLAQRESTASICAVLVVKTRRARERESERARERESEREIESEKENVCERESLFLSFSSCMHILEARARAE